MTFLASQVVRDYRPAVVVVLHSAGVCRAEVAPALVHDWRRAAHVLVGVDAEAVHRPAHQLMMQSVTSGRGVRADDVD